MLRQSKKIAENVFFELFFIQQIVKSEKLTKPTSIIRFLDNKKRILYGQCLDEQPRIGVFQKFN